MSTNLRVISVALLVASATFVVAQAPSDSDSAKSPPPGTRGNADNVKFLDGKKDEKGNPIRLAKSTGHVSNYSEDKVPPYTLPDPLTTNDGKPVTTAETWFKVRRPEIVKFYETEIYGRVPDNAPKVTWEVTETTSGDGVGRAGAAVVKHVVGHAGDKPDGPKINLTEYLPAGVEGPAPMLLSISFGFPAGGAAKAAKAPQRNPNAFDPIGEVLSHGWGYTTLTYTDIQPDRANTSNQGVIGLTLKEGQDKPAPDEWGSISAWAWGISRAIDYLETDKAVNPKQISITGTSRLGKTVLWAGAQDQRVAAVFSVVSGEMGAALIRRDWGETLDDMAQNFPWQFCGNFQKWPGHWNDLPVDQHMLIALNAPRPVYVNGGISDQWSDPKGEFLALVAAGPVYRLLGGKDLGVDVPSSNDAPVPQLDQPLISGDLAFHYHSQGHMAVPADWKAFLEFADRHYKEAAAK